MRYVIAFLAAALAVYVTKLAEHRWGLGADMHLWLEVGVALFVFLGGLEIFSPRRSSLD